MEEEKKVEEEVVEEVPTKKAQSLDDLEVGYVVGLTDEGNFIFDVFGKRKGLVEILGLQQHAAFKIQSIYNQTQVAGDSLVNEVGKGISTLHQKIDQLLAVIAPKEPDNKL